MNPVFLTGYMGSGKTTVGKLLAEKMHLRFIDLDEFIENKYHKTIAQIFAEKGENGFREIEKECLHEVAAFTDSVISTGGGTPCFFDNIEFLNSSGYSVYLKVEPEELVERLKSATEGVRPLIAGFGEAELLGYITENLQKREPYYSRSNLIISGQVNEIVEKIEHYLNTTEN